MTEAAFRRLALALPGTEEKSHFGKADFRVRNRIFASLKGDATGVIKLMPEQQDMLMHAGPGNFKAIPGGWGRMGWTLVDLVKTDEITLKSALQTAWRNVALKTLKI